MSESGRMVGEGEPALRQHPMLLDLREHIWPEINLSGKPIVLDTYNPDPAKIKQKVIMPGERIILPKQVQFFRALRKYECVGYGGAAGGAKSYSERWAMIDFLVEWSIPESEGGLGLKGVHIGLFCNSYPELDDRQLSKLDTIDKEIGRLYGRRNMPEFRLEPRFGGGVIKCRNLKNPEQYSSSEFAGIFIDEAQYVPESTFEFLMSRRRPNLAGKILHCPAGLTFNPGGLGHAWLVRRFVSPETRDKPHMISDLQYLHKGHFFIPSLPKDNPFLTPQYRAALRGLPEKRRKALEDGDFSVFAGQYFRLDPNIHWIMPFKIPQNWNKIRVIDHGGNHPAVCLWMACAPITKQHPTGRVFVYRELSMINTPATEFKKLVVKMSVDEDGYAEEYLYSIADPSMKGDGIWTSIDSTTPWTVYNSQTDGLGSLGLIPANRNRIQRWQALQDGFDYELEGGDLYEFDEDGNAKIKFKKEPKLFIFRNCPYTWASATTVIVDEAKNVDDVKKTKGSYPPGEGDDEIETCGMGYVTIFPGSANIPTVAVPPKRPKAMPNRDDSLLQFQDAVSLPYANF